MEIRQLITFRTVASTLNFARAAASLGYVPSNVTMQIQALEEELGARLLDRLGKHVALTDAGKRFLPQIEKILLLLEESKSVVKEENELTGTVVISASEVLCIYRLPIVLHTFRQRFPHAKIVFRPADASAIKTAICNGNVDIAFILDESLISTSLVVEPLIQEPFRVIVAHDHHLATLPVVRTEDFRNQFFLMAEKGCSYRTHFERELSRSGIDEGNNLEFRSVEAIKQCVIAGMGLAFLPEIAVTEELMQKKLVALPWQADFPTIKTQVLWHKEKWLSPTIQAFLKVTKELFV